MHSPDVCGELLETGLDLIMDMGLLIARRAKWKVMMDEDGHSRVVVKQQRDGL